MSHTDNVIDIRRPVEFSIDGRRFSTSIRTQAAADLLLLAGRSPHRYQLAELRVHRLRPLTYGAEEPVRIRRGTCFLAVAKPEAA
jgi:hypothetical protein